jgi:hypothetical protein
MGWSLPRHKTCLKNTGKQFPGFSRFRTFARRKKLVSRYN